MFSGDVLAPVVTALQETITVTDVISLFASGVKVALPLILTWFGAKWVYSVCKASVNPLSTKPSKD